jgi:hypothetical protein
VRACVRVLQVTFRSVDADQAPQWGDSSHALSALAQAFESERTQEADAASGEGGGDAGAGGEGSEAADTSSSFVHVGSGDDGVPEHATADRHDVDLLERLRLWAQVSLCCGRSLGRSPSCVCRLPARAA